jgi:glycosyltransferase involved in cell wall biosynthesis
MEKVKSNITIGIPCYNSRETIDQTLMSIAVQTVEPFEIIIVDDGSTETYEDIFSKYKNIRHIKLEKNSGVGVARQRILDECKSPYITMVDADDLLLSAVVLYYMYQETKDEKIEYLATRNLRQTNKNTYYEVNPNDIWTHGKVYKINFIRKYDIRFLPLRSHEDIAFTLHVLKYAKVYKADFFSYLWKQNPSSITTQNDLAHHFFDDLIEVAKYHYEKGVRTIFLMAEILYFEWERGYETYGSVDETVIYNKKRLIEFITPYLNYLKDFLKSYPQQYEEFLTLKGPDYNYIQKTSLIDFLEREFK